MSESMLAAGSGRDLMVLPMAGARFARRIGVTTRQGVPLAQRFLEILLETVR